MEDNKNICTIEDYIWETDPETLIKLKNMFLKDKIKIIKKDDG